MKNNKLLEIKNLKISSNNILIVKDISFELNNNEILGIIGESGSGKSLTALSILNLLQYKGLEQKGQLHYKNKLFSKKDIEEILINKVSLIFQDPLSYLNPSMKCGDQIKEVVKDKGNEYIFNLIKKVKIENPKETYYKYPHQLSGGQQQRIMIAIAIAKNPKIIIADEATSSLDSLVKKDILKLLIELKKELNMALIIVSHNLNLIKSITQKVLVMNNGKIVERGKTSIIFKKPKKNYTKNLLLQNMAPKPRQQKNLYGYKTILNVESLFLKLNRSIVLNNINFSVKKGETLGLIGQSGSGKTSISRCITGFYKNYNGNIKYKGTDIKKINRYDLSKEIQLIFQDPYSALNPNIKIINQVADVIKIHFRKNKNEAKNLAIDYLEKVELNENLFYKYPSELSGGERQRVVIARALSVKPKIIICDECVSALDKFIQKSILSLLNKLKIELNLTYIFISHDISIVRFMSDNMIVLKHGNIVDQNSTSKLFKMPKDYTRKLIDSQL